MERVEIKGKLDGVFYNSQVKVNGIELRCVKSIDLHTDQENFIPNIIICVEGIPDIDVMGRVEIKPSPTNIKGACRIIAHELQKHGEFYDSFVASVKTELDEFDNENCVMDNGYNSIVLADRIVKRISGEK